MGDRSIDFPVEGLGDGVVRLRVMAEADLPAIAAACRDPDIPRWTRVPEDYREADARSWFQQEAAERSRGQQLGLVVVDLDGDRLLGSVGIVHPNWAEGRCELGYWVAREARGRGIATPGFARHPVADSQRPSAPVRTDDPDRAQKAPPSGWAGSSRAAARGGGRLLLEPAPGVRLTLARGPCPARDLRVLARGDDRRRSAFAIRRRRPPPSPRPSAGNSTSGHRPRGGLSA